MSSHRELAADNRYEIDDLADWLSVDDFAKRAGIHSKTVRRWIAAGSITAVRMGPKLLRIDPNDLTRLKNAPKA